MGCLWKNLPNYDDPEDTIVSYYKNKTFDFLVVCMHSIIAEWERIYNADDDPPDVEVRKKELPLVKAFAEKLSPGQLKNYAGLAGKFCDVCFDISATEIIAELLKKDLATSQS